MRVYTYSEARQRLTELLNTARRDGEVVIRRRDGQAFVVRPSASTGSPFDVPGVDSGLSGEEIVGLVRESRQASRRFLRRASGSRDRFQPGIERRGRKSTKKRASSGR